jgi:hypothetical protein
MKIGPKLLRFLALFTPVFIVLLILYPSIVKFYEPWVLGAANAFMVRMEPPTQMANDSGGAWRAYDIRDGYRRQFTSWHKGVKYLHYLSLVLVPALLIATPAPWPVRLRLLLLLLPLLWLEHTIAIIGVVRMHYCVALERGHTLCKIGMRIANTSGQLFGAALWALLTFRYWIDSPKTRALPAQPTPAGDSSSS